LITWGEAERGNDGTRKIQIRNNQKLHRLLFERFRNVHSMAITNPAIECSFCRHLVTTELVVVAAAAAAVVLVGGN
jgi:hypothetical protein